MTAPENHEELFPVRLAWRDADVPSKPANHFVVSMSLPTSKGRPDAIHLTIGQADPPVISGSAQEMAQQLSELGIVPIVTLGRYMLTRERLADLIRVLQQSADNFDKAQKQGGAPDDIDHTESV